MYWFNEQNRPEKPKIPWLTHQIWNGCHDLEEILPCFQGISTDIVKTPILCKLGKLEIQVNPKEWYGYINQTELLYQKSSDEEPRGFVPWNDRLTAFQKLCLIKCFKEEKVRLYYFLL